MSPGDILALIGSIPKLIALLVDVFNWIKEITKEDPGKFISDSHAVFNQVTKAKTPDEKQAAAAKLQDFIRTRL